MSEPTLCARCGTVFAKGRWSWKSSPSQPRKTICPACRRIEDNYPTGHVELKGAFIRKHYDEILNLILTWKNGRKGNSLLKELLPLWAARITCWLPPPEPMLLAALAKLYLELTMGSFLFNMPMKNRVSGLFGSGRYRKADIVRRT